MLKLQFVGCGLPHPDILKKLFALPFKGEKTK
jgi:hypothetical protein